MRFSLISALLLAATLAARASLIAYEGFSYESIESMTHLNNLTPFPDATAPAFGWKGSLYHNYQAGKNDAPSTVLTNSLAYPGLTTNGNHIKFLRTIRHTLAAPVGTDPGTLWISFLIQSTATKYNESVYLKTSSPAATHVTINSANSQSFITVDGAPTSVPKSKGLRLYLLRIDFAPTGNQLTFWVNPSLASEPTPESAAFSKTYPTHWTFDRIEIGGNNGGNTGLYTLLDEIRIATTFLSATRASTLYPTATLLSIR